MAHQITVRFTGPLATHQTTLRTVLLTQGYSPLTAGNLLRVAAHLSRWLEAGGYSAEQLSAECIAEFLSARRSEGYSSFCSAGALAPILRYFEQAGLMASPAVRISSSGPVDRLLCPYTDYLRRERCLTQGCVRSYEAIARKFLRWRFGEGQDFDITALKAQEVTSFALQATRLYKVGTAKLAVTALRSFLRYLYLQRHAAVDLRGALPAIAGWRLTGLPKALPAPQIRKLLRSCDRRHHVGRRDYAVLLLLARLGLRASEITTIDLDDIDWRHSELLVHGKGSCVERLPLPGDVGAAVASYLRLSRPNAQTRRLFLRVRAPQGQLRSSTVIMIVKHACKRAGLPMMGAHRLRHTVATEMLRAGCSLDEIAQVLRHRNRDTTAIYAKVDRTALRALARRWPGGVS